MQGGFAVPLWLLPTYLAMSDVDGVAATARAEDAAEADQRVDDVVLGLICACEYYIEKLAGCPRVTDDDGPKTRIPVMFRTDFCAMYGRLNLGQRTAFAAWVAGHARRDERLLGGDLTWNRQSDGDYGPLGAALPPRLRNKEEYKRYP